MVGPAATERVSVIFQARTGFSVLIEMLPLRARVPERGVVGILHGKAIGGVHAQAEGNGAVLGFPGEEKVGTVCGSVLIVEKLLLSPGVSRGTRVFSVME